MASSTVSSSEIVSGETFSDETFRSEPGSRVQRGCFGGERGFDDRSFCERGFSLLELLVVVAVFGVLLSIGFVNLPRERFAVRQAAEGLARDVGLARFQAIRGNTYVRLEVDVANNRYRVLERDGGAVIKLVQLGDARTARAVLSAVDVAANALVFDPRGIGIGLGAQRVTFASTDGSYSRVVAISQQGRASVE